MGIRVIGGQSGDSQRFRVAASNGAGTDGKSAPGGDVDAGELILDGTDNGDEQGASVAAGFTDTATIDGDGNSSGADFSGARIKRKYTRRNGKPGRPSRADTTQTTDDIAGYLASGHLLVAKLLKMPQFTLSDDESNKLALATIRVTQLYDMGIGTEEQRAWINLAMVAGAIYIPKMFNSKSSNVVTMPVAQSVPQRAKESAPGWMQ